MPHANRLAKAGAEKWTTIEYSSYALYVELCPADTAEELLSGAASADADVRARSRIVYDTLRFGPSEAARRQGTTRQTATKWTSIYRTEGIEGLSRSNKQNACSPELRRSILTAPLWMPDVKWSSRSIAASLEITQSLVARVWEPFRTRSAAVRRLEIQVPSGKLRVLGFASSDDGSVLVMQCAGSVSGVGPDAGGALSTVAARAVRTILVAALVGHSGDADSTEMEKFWEKTLAAADDDADVVAVTIGAVGIPASVSLRCATENESEWLSVLSFLGARGLSTPAAVLHDLEARLRLWSGDPQRSFYWSLSDSRRYSGRPAARNSRTPRSPELALAEQVVESVRSDLRDGTLNAGDRVTERYLATRLRTTRGQIHTAMRLLESEGLFTITDGRSLIIPVPMPSDLMETYSARRALGSMAIRAAVRWSPESRAAVVQALHSLELCALTGDVLKSGEDDLDFQNALAEASGLVKIGPMLQMLADHLRMFIVVLGLDYTYPADVAYRESKLIFDAIDAGDAEHAVELWRMKMSDAMSYMVRKFRDVNR